MRERPVTANDVAQLAGVSQPTVSRAFDPEGNISPATRTRVLEAAKSLGYQPNAIARSLSTQRTNIIGLIMGNITRSLFYPKVIEIFTRYFQALEKQVLLINAPEDRTVDEILPRVLSYRVDGLVITSTTPGQEIIDECTRRGIPVVLLNRTAPGTGANAVCSDNEGGGRIAADVLLDAGHQNMAFVAGVGITATNLLRKKGFADRVRERGYEPTLHEQGEYTYEAGFEAGLRLLDQDAPPDGVFCAADIIALGVMDAARYNLGIKIPDELSIIGYDDIPMAGWPAYDLTTIHQPVTEMVENAIHLLTPQEGQILTRQVILLPGELIRRTSTRKPE